MANSVNVQHTAVTGIATVTTANTVLDGGGSITSLITGSTNGTLVKGLIFKAQSDVSEGMLRIFVKEGGGPWRLLSESYVVPIVRSGRDTSYFNFIPVNYMLANAASIGISTEIGDRFSIIAEAFDINFATSPTFQGNTVEFIGAAGTGVVSAPNPNLNGTGALVQIFTAAAAGAGFNGAMITSIVVKAQQTVSAGMVRLYIKDAVGGTATLFCEVPIPSFVRNGHLETFEFQVIVGGSLCIAPGYSIWASTENAEIFSVIVEGANWKFV